MSTTSSSSPARRQHPKPICWPTNHSRLLHRPKQQPSPLRPTCTTSPSCICQVIEDPRIAMGSNFGGTGGGKPSLPRLFVDPLNLESLQRRSSIIVGTPAAKRRGPAPDTRPGPSNRPFQFWRRWGWNVPQGCHTTRSMVRERAGWGMMPEPAGRILRGDRKGGIRRRGADLPPQFSWIMDKRPEVETEE